MSYAQSNIHSIRDYPLPTQANQQIANPIQPYQPYGNQGIKQSQMIFCPICKDNRNSGVHSRLSALSWTLILAIILPILFIPALIMICMSHPLVYYVHKCPICHFTIARIN